MRRTLASPIMGDLLEQAIGDLGLGVVGVDQHRQGRRTGF
jgi:hypothetical protein